MSKCKQLRVPASSPVLYSNLTILMRFVYILPNRTYQSSVRCTNLIRIVLQIDWEWIGSDNARVQSNYFSKGDTTTYDRGDFHPVNNPTGSVHTYSLEWKRDVINWIIDGKPVRTLNAKDAKGGSGFPQTPMQVKLGTWCAGRQGASPGTVQWAGGYSDFSKGPFKAFYKSVTIVDYAGGDGPGKAAKEYVYGDKSGSAQSIQVRN